MNSGSNYITIYNIECSPSYLINNLSNSKDSLYFIHNSQSFPRVLVVNKPLLKANNTQCVSILNSSEKNEMLFIKYFSLKDAELIAIGLYSGFKLWNKDGNKLLLQILSTTPSSNKNKIYAVLSASEFLRKGGNEKNGGDSILVGDNLGQLFIIYGPDTNWKYNKIWSSPKEESILSIGSSIDTNIVGVSLDSGDILLLKIEEGNCNTVKKIEGDHKQNISINSVIFSNKNKTEFFLACGFITGEIKIISLKDYNLKFSINSNLRSVGPMTVKNNNEIIVGSDDGQINVWAYEEKENGDKIVLKNNILIEDKMIMGLAYDKDDLNLYVTCYDFPEIIKISEI